MSMKNRKATTAIVAGVTAAALLLGGTFAWTSISQQAKNESAGVVNVGGRLHDDFNGKNKDIYVENFTDPLNGGQPIYARIKLTEYMEVGSEAGKVDENGNWAADRNAQSVVANATIDNVDSWSVHKPADNCAECLENGDLCVFHKHWTWTMGGQTTYMPTFNKDKDSLKADINGTYQGTTAGDKVYYDDYVVYTTDSTAEGVGKNIPENEKGTYDGSIYSVIGTEYYDDDTDKEENDHAAGTGVRVETGVTHTAKQTVEGTVIPMSSWNGTPGNYWVYDTDGWAYWANPILPGGATGLLLSGIDMVQNPGEKCYYAINVVAQFATVGDWEYFEDGGKPSDKAQELLEAASKNIPEVSISPGGNITLARGESAVFTANVTMNAQTGSNVNWRVVDAEGNPLKTATTIDENGKLTIGADETNSNIIVVAESKDYPGAVALKPITVTVLQVTVTAADNATAVDAGETLQFTATVTLNEEAQTIPVTWTVSGAKDNSTAIDPSTGLLTVGQNEAGNTVLTVTATTSAESGAFQGSTTVTVNDDPLRMRITGGSVVAPGDSVQLSTVFTKKGVEQESLPVTWSVSGDNGATTISDSGLLKVNANDNGGTALTVTAQTEDGLSDTYEVYTVKTSFDMVGDTTGTYTPFCYWGITDSGNDEYTLWMFETKNQMLLANWSDEPDSVTINGESFVEFVTNGPRSASTWLASDGPSPTMTPWITTTSDDPHHGLEDKITKVVFLTELKPTGTGWWFNEMLGLKELHGLDNLNMSECTNAQYMFGGGGWGRPTAYTTLDLSSWDVSKIEDFSYMFLGAEKLTKIVGIEDWNTASATDMTCMFQFCCTLEADLSNWNVSSKPKHTSFAFTPEVVENKITEPKWLDEE